MFNLTSKTLPRALVLTLALGITTAATLSPAHADGRSIAKACVERDDCSIVIWPGDSGAFTIVLAGGGVIYCPSLDGECVVVSPDKGTGGKGGNPAPVANPITKAPVANTGGFGNTVPTGGKPVTNPPPPPKGTTGLPPVFSRPLPGSIFKPIGHPTPPVLLARGAHR